MFVHGSNIEHKEHSKKKYSDKLSKEYLKEIRGKYNEWREANEALKGPFKEATEDDDAIILKRLNLLVDYKDFIDQQHFAEHFDSRSNLHSSVIEEFMFYLFRDLALEFSGKALIGKSHAFKDVFFNPNSYEEMVKEPKAKIETKDHDFVIGSTVETKFTISGSDQSEEYNFEVPAVAIECKTYLDKTMLEGSSTAASQLKHKNPNAIYIVVMEWLKLTSDVNLKKYDVDQIYVLRKQKNTDREYRYDEGYEKKPIDFEVVNHLFSMVRNHLTKEWKFSVETGLERGYLL